MACVARAGVAAPPATCQRLPRAKRRRCVGACSVRLDRHQGPPHRGRGGGSLRGHLCVLRRPARSGPRGFRGDLSRVARDHGRSRRDAHQRLVPAPRTAGGPLRHPVCDGGFRHRPGLWVQHGRLRGAPLRLAGRRDGRDRDLAAILDRPGPGAVRPALAAGGAAHPLPARGSGPASAPATRLRRLRSARSRPPARRSPGAGAPGRADPPATCGASGRRLPVRDRPPRADGARYLPLVFRRAGVRASRAGREAPVRPLPLHPGAAPAVAAARPQARPRPDGPRRPLPESRSTAATRRSFSMRPGGRTRPTAPIAGRSRPGAATRSCSPPMDASCCARAAGVAAWCSCARPIDWRPRRPRSCMATAWRPCCAAATGPPPASSAPPSGTGRDRPSRSPWTSHGWRSGGCGRAWAVPLGSISDIRADRA